MNVQLKDSQGNGLFVLFLWGKKRGCSAEEEKNGLFHGDGGMDIPNNKTF